jgi:hypothetical protein
MISFLFMYNYHYIFLNIWSLVTQLLWHLWFTLYFDILIHRNGIDYHKQRNNTNTTSIALPNKIYYVYCITFLSKHGFLINLVSFTKSYKFHLYNSLNIITSPKLLPLLHNYYQCFYTPQNIPQKHQRNIKWTLAENTIITSS